ncbi:MAG TPA: hypothetical protein VMU92_05435 [Acidobacteriaceae bacterium]|nr:hypothetical protein [Acidobacteriaceae bacterium]
MASVVTQLEELHARLGRALEDPQSVGMQSGMIPQPLAELLRSTQAALGQLLIEIKEEGSSSTLEAELSQDADHL